jgi:hypothetical protein
VLKRVAEGFQSGVPDELAVGIVEVHTFIGVGLDDGALGVRLELGPHAEDLGHEAGRTDLGESPSGISAAGRDVMARPRFRALSWDATRPLPGEPHALPGTPGARLVCRSTRWRESISP